MLVSFKILSTGAAGGVPFFYTKQYMTPVVLRAPDKVTDDEVASALTVPLKCG